MANLLGQNIGTNYKGILNLNTLNGNLSGTLQAVTDGDGNASPLQLSTSQGQLSSVVFASGVISRNTNDATGLRLFGGVLITTNDSGYIQLQRDTTNFGAPIFGLANANFDSNFFRWERNGTEIARLTATGNLYLGSGGITPSARLHVRGDGTNPVFRGESSAGANFVTINNSGQLVFGSAGANEPLIVNYNGVSTESGTGNALRIRQRANINGTLMQYWADGLFNNTTSGTNISHHFLSSGYAGAAGNGNYRATQIDYTINNSGAQTGTATGIFLNATETALNGMTHNLMDLGTGGGTYVSRFNVGRVHDAAFRFNSMPASNNWRPLCSISRIGTPGTASLFFGVGSGGSTASAFIASNNDELYLGTDASNTFTTNIVLKANAVGFVGFGGLTNAFPALKRNSTTLQVRVADDTNFADIEANIFATGNGRFSSNTLYVSNAGGLHLGYGGGGGDLNLYPNSGTTRGASLSTSGMIIGSGTINASAVLQADSTTKGFLPPRMTTAQKTAITSPAKGLVVYDTDTDKLCVYNGAWTDLH